MPTESENTAVKAQEGTQANPEMQILDDEKLVSHITVIPLIFLDILLPSES